MEFFLPVLLTVLVLGFLEKLSDAGNDEGDD
jgi:hypothetical protein